MDINATVVENPIGHHETQEYKILNTVVTRRLGVKNILRLFQERVRNGYV